MIADASAAAPIAGVVATYADIRAGEVCALFGSTDHLEIAVNGGSAAAALALTRGAVVEITTARPIGDTSSDPSSRIGVPEREVTVPTEPSRPEPTVTPRT